MNIAVAADRSVCSRRFAEDNGIIVGRFPTIFHGETRFLGEKRPVGTRRGGHVMDNSGQVTINGRRYRVGALLSGGVGSYSHVFSGMDARGRAVALKMVNTEAMSKVDAVLHGHWRAHLEREITFLRNMRTQDTKRIVQLFDYGLHDGQPVVVLERLSTNVAQWLAHYRKAHAQPLSLSRVLDWAEQILEGLESIHRAGFVYRDLKFSNILVNAEGTALKLADFGAIQKLSELHSRSFVGTPATMAPEQCIPARTTVLGDEYAVDQRADYYALGVLLFLLLTGRPTTATQRRISQWLSARAQGNKAPFRAPVCGLTAEEIALLDRAIAVWIKHPPTWSKGSLSALIQAWLSAYPNDRPIDGVHIRTVLAETRAAYGVDSAPTLVPVLSKRSQRSQKRSLQMPAWWSMVGSVLATVWAQRAAWCHPKASGWALVGLTSVAASTVWLWRAPDRVQVPQAVSSVPTPVVTPDAVTMATSPNGGQVPLPVVKTPNIPMVDTKTLAKNTNTIGRNTDNRGQQASLGREENADRSVPTVSRTVPNTPAVNTRHPVRDTKTLARNTNTIGRNTKTIARNTSSLDRKAVDRPILVHPTRRAAVTPRLAPVPTATPVAKPVLAKPSPQPLPKLLPKPLPSPALPKPVPPKPALAKPAPKPVALPPIVLISKVTPKPIPQPVPPVRPIKPVPVLPTTPRARPILSAPTTPTVPVSTTPIPKALASVPKEVRKAATQLQRQATSAAQWAGRAGAQVSQEVQRGLASADRTISQWVGTCPASRCPQNSTDRRAAHRDRGDDAP